MTIVGSVVIALTVADGMRAREHATALARHYCNEAGLQFLDGTVALRKWSIRFSGGIALQRRFEFQYSNQDNQRYTGLIEMLGQSMTQFLLVNEHGARDRSLPARSTGGGESIH